MQHNTKHLDNFTAVAAKVDSVAGRRRRRGFGRESERGVGHGRGATLASALLLVPIVVPLETQVVGEEFRGYLIQNSHNGVADVALLDQQRHQRLDDVHQQLRESLSFRHGIQTQNRPVQKNVQVGQNRLQRENGPANRKK